MQAKGHDVRPVGWVQQQLHQIRTEPARFRQRAGSLLAVGIMITGAVFASNNSIVRPTVNVAAGMEASAASASSAEEASALESTSLTTVNGQILDENGHPLIGATILDKISGRGVSTDAQGKYTLAVPAHKATQLQFGYGGYTEEMVQVKGRGVQNMTLLPRTDQPKKHHWWQF
jgi:hypothetical protein